MIHEFALEPELVATWVDRRVGRYFLDQFGLGRPRIVSRYPRRWKSRVWDAFQRFQSGNDLERKRMEELLERLNERMVKRPGSQWNPEATWLDNAEEEHARVPFQAILARANPRAHNDVLVADDLDNTTPRWKGCQGRNVRRSAEALAEAVAPMLRNATEWIFVDPHFGPEKGRFRETLRAFLRAAIKKRPAAPPNRIEFLCDADKGAEEEFFRSECEKRLPSIVPRGLRVDVIRLRLRKGGERLHNRYILTNLGGVTFGVGLDQGRKGDSDSDDIQILDRAQYNERWNQYASATPAFERAEPVITIEGVG